MGTTKGISAKVSRTLSHLDLPRVISHAKGTPARKSKAATIKAIIKEFEIAFKAVFINAGLIQNILDCSSF